MSKAPPRKFFKLGSRPIRTSPLPSHPFSATGESNDTPTWADDLIDLVFDASARDLFRLFAAV